MKGLESWITIITLANDEIKRLRAFNEKAVQILESHRFFASGSGSPLGDYESVNRMTEEIIREAKE